MILLLLAVGAAYAAGEEGGGAGVPPAEVVEAAEANSIDLSAQLTDLKAAEALPHHDLDRAQALDLLEGVFEAELQSPAGIFDGLQVERFLSNNAAVLPGMLERSSVPVSVGTPNGEAEGSPVLLESTLPLRTEDAHGNAEAVDLTLEHSGGEIQSAAPLVEVGIPEQLGEGISLPETGVKVTLVGAADERTPSIIEESVAAYPNIAADSDLALAPTPTGLEALTTLRSADSPRTQTYHLQLPSGASLREAQGGAEVVRGKEVLLGIPAPSAIDAAGEPVPVSMSVSGDSLIVAAEPSASTSWPALIDPFFETYAWQSKGTSGTAGWTSWTNNATLAPAYGEHFGTGYLGLYIGITSATHPAGSEAVWTNTVPRYAEDQAKGLTPTSYITHFNAEHFTYLGSSGSTNPFIFAGIYDPALSKWAGKPGSEAAWSAGGNTGLINNTTLSFENGKAGERDSEAKIVYGLAAASLEASTTTGRESYLGAASIEIADEEGPTLANPSTASGWVNATATAPVTVEATDTGLGVKSARFEVPGQGTLTVPNGCIGTVASPCPRSWKASLATTEYDPSKMPQGEDQIPLAAFDVLGNASSLVKTKAVVKVDHTAPAIALSGTLTEQAALGIRRHSYALKAVVTDGSEAAPQSGLSEAKVEMDGVVVASQAPKCATKNCSATLEWTLEASKYSPGPHTVKVTSTDAVGLSRTKELRIRLNPWPEPDPIAAYSFDEGEGLIAHDSVGHHDGTIEGAEWVPGRFGTALEFSPSAKSIVTIPGSEDLRFENFTLEAWVQPSEARAMAPIIEHTSPEDYGYGLWDGGELAGKPEALVTNHNWVNSYAYSSKALPTTEWSYLTATDDGSKLRLDVNGELVYEGSAAKVKAGKGNLTIGGGSGFAPSEYFAGKIDEVALYNRALTQTEIKTDRHTAVQTPPSEDPVAAYPFDENEGETAHDSGGNHDAKVEGAKWATGKFGSALEFSAAKSNALTVPDSEDLRLEEFTLSAWVYPTESRAWAPVIAKTNSSGRGFALYAGGEVAGDPEGIISYHESVESYVFGAKSLPLNTWSDLAVTSDRGKLRLYDNGELIGERAGADVQATEAVLQIGGNPAGWGGFFNGKIDEPRIYNRALSAAEVKEDMNAAVLDAAPAECTLTSPFEGEQSAKWLKLGAACVGRSVAEEEWVEGVSGVTFQYREGKTGPFQTIPASLVRNARRQPVHWPVSVKQGAQGESLYFDAAHATSKLRKEGGPVQIRAVFERRAGGERVSPPSEATVNRKLGGPTDATAPVGPGNLDLLTGNFSVSETDVSVPVFNSSFELSRTFNSREAESGTIGPLGPGWKPSVPVEMAGEGEWRSLKFESFTETIEGKTYAYGYAQIAGPEGAELSFEEESGSFIAPPELSGWTLTKAGSTFVLTDPEGNATTFQQLSGGAEYTPVSISQTGGEGNTTQMVYKVNEKGQKLLTEIVGNVPPGVTCTAIGASVIEGCRTLIFTYASMTKWGGEASLGERLEKVTYYSPGNGGPWTVAEYGYSSAGRLTEEWDPRISPALKTKYTYNGSGQLATITPPGQEPWTLEYAAIDEETGPGRLTAVKRPSLLASPSTAQTTIAYNVPISGSGAPYEMNPASVAKWGQTDLPSEATAIFPPDEVPSSSPPSSYSHATVQYLDVEGREVNTATAAGAGTSSASIMTAEYDQFANVVRELTPQNRLRALGVGAESALRSKELDTHRTYSANGTEMLQEWGPLHQVRLESGTTAYARSHTTVAYDEGMPGGIVPDPHLPTKETTGASIPGVEVDADQRVSEMKYNWTLRLPTETIIDPSGLKIRSVATYEEKTRLPLESRQPSDPEGKGAGTTKTFYWNVGPEPKGFTCSGKPKWAGLPCVVMPAAQPGTSGQPELLVKQFKSYNALGEPTEVIESPGGGETNTRKSITTYDSAGRVLTQKIEGGGEAIPKVETTYNSMTGLPTGERFVCETSCTGFDSQETKATYDALGRVKEYEDADGNVTKTTYDVDGRPVTTSDGKGSETYTYDSVTGLLTKLEDSAAGTFTAAYDADGNQTERTLPDGLTAKTTFNEAGEPTVLSYLKASSCGASCNWLEQSVERSVRGQILAESGTLESKQYAYDKASRLIEAKETPTGGSCTTRLYSYDADSNRKSLTTRSPGIGGACGTSGGTEQKYEYDSADRLLGTGLTYDNFGRITSLPASYAGGKTLTTSYFSDNMLASQTQNGITNSYELDGSLRQRQRLQGGGGIEGVEVFHYDDPSDGVAWTQRGSVWSRNITGIGGELAAIQESSGTTTLPLTNLHGDVVAKAALSSSETKLLATYRYDEFGNPVSGSAGRFSWLGGKARRTELASGVIQMGARSYVPTIGRFLTPDPVEGGSANPYDYANQDPVNAFDLEGTCSGREGCERARRREERRARHAVSRMKKLILRRIGREHARSAESSCSIGGFIPCPHLPWEKQANAAVGTAEKFLKRLNDATTCTQSSLVAGAGAKALETRAAGLAATAARAISGAASKAAGRLATISLVLGAAAALGLC